MAACYILHSKSTNKFYIGSTQVKVEERLYKHNTSFYGKHFTSASNDWQIFMVIECVSYKQARKIEIHIKKMKSKKYIKNLGSYPQMIQKLLEKYNPQ